MSIARKFFTVGFSLVCMATGALADTAAPAAAALPSAAAQPAVAVTADARLEISEGTKVRMELADDVKSGGTPKGSEVRYYTLEDVLGPNKEVLIKKGSRATGVVTESRGAGGLGRKGRLQFTVDYVLSADDLKVPLRSNQEANGKSRQGSMVAVTLLLSPLGLFMKGKNITIKKGTVIEAYVNEKTKVMPAPAPPAPAPVVAAPTPKK